jgi:quinol monooxygenase YgiN
MIIVAGHMTVEPQRRESYVERLASVVERGRAAAGCLDFAITADLLDPGRVNVFELWESQATLEAFRRTNPNMQSAAKLSPSLAEYDVAATRTLFAEETA